MFRRLSGPTSLVGLLVLFTVSVAASPPLFPFKAVSATTTSATQLRGRATSQAVIYSDDNQTVTDTEWHDLFDGVGEGAVSSRGLRTVEIAANTSGGAIDIRAIGTGPDELFVPPMAHFDPSAGTTSFSFEFARPVVEKSGCHRLRVQWRSTSGASATVHSWLTVIRYRAVKSKEICE